MVVVGGGTGGGGGGAGLGGGRGASSCHLPYKCLKEGTCHL